MHSKDQRDRVRISFFSKIMLLIFCRASFSFEICGSNKMEIFLMFWNFCVPSRIGHHSDYVVTMLLIRNETNKTWNSMFISELGVRVLVLLFQKHYLTFLSKKQQCVYSQVAIHVIEKNSCRENDKNRIVFPHIRVSQIRKTWLWQS